MRNLLPLLFCFMSLPTFAAENAECERDCLIKIADTYLAAIAANNPAAAPLADDIRFVENITPMQPGEGTWANATSVSGTYRIVVPDPRQNSVGLMAVVTRRGESGEALALLAARLKVRNGRITEAEHLIEDLPPAVDAADMVTPRAAMTSAVPPNERMDYREIAMIAGSYYDALNLNDGSLAPFADDCERKENGMITAAYYLEPEVFDAVDVNGKPPPAVARDCIGQMSSRRFAYIDSIDNRRIAAVDPVQGLAMGLSFFRQSLKYGPHRMIAANGTEVMWDEQREPYDLPAIHIFKITNGQIHEVEAIGIFVPYDSDTGWE